MSDSQKNRIHSGRIRKVTNLGLAINVLLSVSKVVVGWVANSTALIADGVHSISDMATDVAVLVGVKLGAKEPDVEHPYGHGRMETFAAAVVALALILVGLGLVYQAGYSMVDHKKSAPSIIVLVVAFISVVSKEWLYQITRKVAKETHSSAAYANAWHHRSDALSSVAVLLGVGSMYFGFIYGDEFATVAVGIMIALVGFSVLADSINEFSERAADKVTQEQITSILKAVPGIRDWHKLRTRIAGREVFLDLHILVDPQLNITEAHEIADRLEMSLHEQIDRPVNITVHIEPDTPELRARGR
jgi:cation diffusion facilitator family transporter